MKIHIDTSTAEEKAKAEKVKSSPTKRTPPSSQNNNVSNKVASASTSQQSITPKPNLPKSPPKEPKPPKDVAQARKAQSNVLKQRQLRETEGRIKGAPRDVDAGSGFWPPLSPLL